MARPGLVRAALAFALPTAAALFPVLTGLVYGVAALALPAKRRLPGELAGLVFVATLLLSALLSGRGLQVIGVAALFVLALGALWLLVARLDSVDVEPLLAGMLALLAVNLVAALVQVHGSGLPRASGVLMHANLLGAVAAPMALVFLPRPGARALGASRITGAAVALVLLVYCASRGAFVGLLVGAVGAAVVLLLRPYRAPARSKRPTAVALGGALVLLIGGLLAVYLPGSPLYGRLQVLDTVGDPLGRAFLWSTALELIAHRPLLGYGPAAWTAYAPVVEPMIRTDVTPHSHSLFLEIALWGGTLGLGSLLWLGARLLAAFWKSSRLLSGWSSVGIGALLIMATVSLFDAAGNYFQVLTLWALVLGIVLTMSDGGIARRGNDDQRV